jgi:hypothetical protein
LLAALAVAQGWRRRGRRRLRSRAVRHLTPGE